MRFLPAPGTRALDGGRVLVGGSPVTFVRLTPAGAAVAARLLAGEVFASGGPAVERLADRLVAAGLLLPDPPGGTDAPVRAEDVAVVVPTYGRPGSLAGALAALVEVGRGHPDDRPGRVVVVDDGSPEREAEAVAAVARQHGAEVVRSSSRAGPGAARNLGWRVVEEAVVAFVDSDVEVTPGWLAGSSAHLADPAVAVVAPRVVTPPPAPGASSWARFDAMRSPLDLGATPGLIRPRSRIAYAPAATLLVRRRALEELEGFDETLRLGEDVDLLWRAGAAGHRCWYTGDRAVVHHPSREGLAAALRQRYDYGTSAAALDRVHPGAASPPGVSGWSVAVWAAAVAGHPVVAAGVAGGTVAALARRLDFLERPVVEAVRLGLGGHLRAGEPLARAVLRPWFPFGVAAALLSRRARPWLAAAVVVPAVADWRRRRPDADPLRWMVASWADDLAYSAGVWAGCRRERRLGPLRPALRRWPPRGGDPGRPRPAHPDRLAQ